MQSIINGTLVTGLFLFICSEAAPAQIDIKGQFWASVYAGNDAAAGQSAYESIAGYIPTLSVGKEFGGNRLLDAEWGYRTVNTFTGGTLLSEYYQNHRLWVRYASETLDARAGLQKIIFGPSQVLRPLSWFDTYDLTDATGQTDGVNALRLRWFRSNTSSFWAWAIWDENNYLSPGGRAEFSTRMGEWGLTIHHDPGDSVRMIGQSGVMINERHNRYAVDFRYDGLIGLWNESALISADQSRIGMLTIGADYTLPIGSGIMVMAEAMHIDSETSLDTSSNNYSAIMAMLPIGMIHQIMYISQQDWTKNRAYNYIRWSVTYDSFSLNFILSLNPYRSEYGLASDYLPESSVGFGRGFQFVFVYNH
ncbi:MAG: hypothetical protein QF418_01155 [Candidatus Marinimicrobia bacterium]|nr:hypothetical protein [Candidatus Neomarinimicrobiota bacterium]